MHYAPPLTAQEQAHVRLAIRYLRVRLGSWVAVARTVRIKRATVRRVRDGGRVRPYVAARVARAVSVRVEDLTRGKYLGPDPCPNCGCPRKA
jgi:hypothetical protein